MIYSSTNGHTWQTTNINGSNTHLVEMPDRDWMVYQEHLYPYKTRAAFSTNPNIANSWASYEAVGIPTNNRGDFVRRVVVHEGRLVLLGADPEDGVAEYLCYFDGDLVASGVGNAFRFDVTTTDPRGHTVTVWANDSHGLRQMDSVRLRVVPPEPENLLASGEGSAHVPKNFTITYDGVFYAAGTRSVYRSLDGKAWERVHIPSFPGSIIGMASGNGSLVIQIGGSFITTRDGVNWTHFQPSLTNYGVLIPVEFRSGVFIAAFSGVNTTGGFMTSADGLRWDISHASGAGRLGWSANSPDGTIIGVGTLSPWGIRRSIDGGTNWQAIPSLQGTTSTSHGVFADGKFHVAVTGGVVSSRNGFNWSRVPQLPDEVASIQSNESVFVVIDNTGGVWTSKNGAAWSQTLPGTSGGATYVGTGQSIDALGDTIVVAGGAMLVFSRDDARSWQSATVNGQAFSTQRTYHKVVAGATEFLVLEGTNSNANTLMRSTDGEAFTTVPGMPAKTWRDVAWNGSEWMLLASDGSLYRSTNQGLEWSEIATPGMDRGSAVVWFNNRWVVIGAAENSHSSGYRAYTVEAGDVFVNHSPIGVVQSLRQARAVVAHGRLLVAVQGFPPVVSQDGIGWTTVQGTNLGGGGNSYTVYHTPDGFAAFGGWSYPQQIWTSGPDGLAWSRVPTPFANVTTAANLGDRVFVFAPGSIAELHRSDLALTLPAFTPVTVGVGNAIEAEVTITNLGTAIPDDSAWRATAWLGQNRFFGDGKNVPIGTFVITAPMPAPGASAGYPVSFVLPNEIKAGDQYLIITLSSLSGVRESNVVNNTAFSETAFIHIPEWEFSMVTNGNGEVRRDFAATRYPHNAQVSLAAIAGKGAVFAGWDGDALSPNNQITILMDGDKSLQANFSDRATLQVFTRGQGGVAGLAELGSYPVDEMVTVTAVPEAGWSFSHWSGAAEGGEATAIIEMDATKVLTAHFILPIEAWREIHFTAEQLVDPAISGDLMDPDGDGVPNWIEYLHGSDPQDATSTGRTAITLQNGSLRCIFTRNIGAADGGAVVVQGGRDLGDWNAPDVQERILSSENGIETVEVRLPVAGYEKGFMRFRYTAPGNGGE